MVELDIDVFGYPASFSKSGGYQELIEIDIGIAWLFLARKRKNPWFIYEIRLGGPTGLICSSKIGSINLIAGIFTANVESPSKDGTGITIIQERMRDIVVQIVSYLNKQEKHGGDHG